MRFSLAAFLTPILAAASLAQPNGRCRVRPSQDETVSPSSSTVGDNGASVTQPSQAGVVKPLSTFISTSLVIVQATSASRDSGYTRNGGGVAAALAGGTTKSVGKTRTMTTKTTGTTLPSATSVSSSGKSVPPPASSSAGSGGGGGGSDPLGMVALHDSVRAQYGAGPVTWNAKAASYAQNYASECKWNHSHGQYGENLAAGTGETVTNLFGGWSGEAATYAASPGHFSETAGHFTQVVWKSTTSIGCALVNCVPGPDMPGKQFLVCEYDPAGNLIGAFDKNVGTKGS